MVLAQARSRWPRAFHAALGADDVDAGLAEAREAVELLQVMIEREAGHVDALASALLDLVERLVAVGARREALSTSEDGVARYRHQLAPECQARRRIQP